MTSGDKVRIDKWLWAARFFKTRSLAAKAASGGKVQINGQRIKPARSVVIGDIVRINRYDVEFIVTVLGLADKRGPAKVARTLYEESPESEAAREVQRDERRIQRLSSPKMPDQRPGKRDRRLIREFVRK